MKTPAERLKTYWSKEQPASIHINIIGHYNESTLIDKDGKLIKLFQLTGLDAVTQAAIQLDIAKNRRNSLLKSLSSEYALYTWTIRSKTAEFPSGEFKQPFAKTLNEAYKAKIAQKALFHNQLYLALIAKPPAGAINQTLNWFKKLSYQWDKAARDAQLKKNQ